MAELLLKYQALLCRQLLLLDSLESVRLASYVKLYALRLKQVQVVQLCIDCFNRLLHVGDHLFLAPGLLAVEVEQQGLHVSAEHLPIKQAGVHQHTTLPVSFVHRRRVRLNFLFNLIQQAGKFFIILLGLFDYLAFSDNTGQAIEHHSAVMFLQKILLTIEQMFPVLVLHDAVGFVAYHEVDGEHVTRAILIRQIHFDRFEL